MQLLIATGNLGKMREIRAIIDQHPDLNLHVLSLSDFQIPEPPEPHATYMENAKHKAKYYSDLTGLPTLSDDAGLCINALNGFPGVNTKDFVIECGGLLQAFAKLEELLKDAPDLSAYFVCAAAIYIPQQHRYICFEAKDHGRMTFPPRGTNCFGFDPVYIPDGYNNSMAELGMELKNKIGHRGQAMRGVLDALQQSLQATGSAT